MVLLKVKNSSLGENCRQRVSFEKNIEIIYIPGHEKQ